MGGGGWPRCGLVSWQVRRAAKGRSRKAEVGRQKAESVSRKSEGHDHLVIVLRSNGGYENEKNCQFFALFVSGFGRMRGVPVE